MSQASPRGLQLCTDEHGVFKKIPEQYSDFMRIPDVVQKVTFMEEVSIQVVKKHSTSENRKSRRDMSKTQPSVSFDLSPVEGTRAITCADLFKSSPVPVGRVLRSQGFAPQVSRQQVTEQPRVLAQQVTEQPQDPEPQVTEPQMLESPEIPEPIAPVAVEPEPVAPIPTKKPRISKVHGGNVYAMCAASPTGSVVRKNITFRIVQEISDKSTEREPVNALPSVNDEERPADTLFPSGSGGPLFLIDPFNKEGVQIDPDLEVDLDTNIVVNEQENRGSEYYSEADGSDEEDDDSSVYDEMQFAGKSEFTEEELEWSPPQSP
jgi:hypothetical protein